MTVTVETIDLVGVKPDGAEDKLGKSVMPPSMKIPEILRSYGFDHDDEDTAFAYAAMDELVSWMIAQGWKHPPLLVEHPDTEPHSLPMLPEAVAELLPFNGGEL